MTARTDGAATRLLTAGTAAALTFGLAACADDDAPADDGATNPPPVVTGPTTAPEPGTGAEPTDNATDDSATDGSNTNPPPVVTEPTTASEPGAGETPTGDVPTAAETDPAALPPFGAAGEPQTWEPSGEPLLPSDVRVGEHEGFERVVLELAGDGVPGWRVEYVQEAIEDGKGRRIDVDGDAILSVHVSGTRYPEEGEAAYYDGPSVLEGDDIIEEVHYLGVFEGLTQLFIGVDDGVADYRVFALADPARLVIDIQDDD